MDVIMELNLQYENVVKAMEGSFVKLKIAEKEERMKIEREKKNSFKNVNGSVQKDGKYYLVRLEMELEKLKFMINEAESDQRLSQIPEEASGKIRNAVGKAQLLITKKFKQFEELCRDNIEDNPDKRQNEMETKASDLQGYWEMMFTQIDDVKSLFSHIEKLKANNWTALEGDAIETTMTNGSPTEKVKTTKTNKSSPARARKKKQNGQSDDKVKKEAKSRLAAIRKQGKLRQQQLNTSDSESLFISFNGSTTALDSSVLNNNVPLDSSENGSLNSSVTDDASLNSSLNSSLEGLYDSSLNDSHRSTPNTLEEG